MGTRILKIDGKMPEINECKVNNPQNSTSRNWANLSQPSILTFFKDKIFQRTKTKKERFLFQPFFHFHALGVPEWKISHIEWSKKAQNTRKSLKNDCVTSLRNLQDVCKHPVDVFGHFNGTRWYVYVWMVLNDFCEKIKFLWCRWPGYCGIALLLLSGQFLWQWMACLK